MVQSLRAGRVGEVARHFWNRLERVAERFSPWIGRLRCEFQRTEALAHQMSGSGSSYFGMFRNKRAARRAAAVLRSRLADVNIFC
ncbi:MAG: hypothetical protein GTO41_17265, partial [Burkholderiales bacterium]|nr:hypothetical protein [Burkholderiales bacterium]